MSPISHRRETLSRVAKSLPTWQVFQDALRNRALASPVPGRPPPVRNMPSMAPSAQGGKLGIGHSERVADSPIVELRQHLISRFAGSRRRPASRPESSY